MTDQPMNEARAREILKDHDHSIDLCSKQCCEAEGFLAGLEAGRKEKHISANKTINMKVDMREMAEAFDEEVERLEAERDYYEGNAESNYARFGQACLERDKWRSMAERLAEAIRIHRSDLCFCLDMKESLAAFEKMKGETRG